MLKPYFWRQPLNLWITELRELKLHPHGLAFIVLEGAMKATRGKKSNHQIYSAMKHLSYNNEWSGRHVHCWNRTNTKGVNYYFIIGFNFYCTRWNAYLPSFLEQEPVAKQVISLRGEATAIMLISGHSITPIPSDLCSNHQCPSLSEKLPIDDN